MPFKQWFQFQMLISFMGDLGYPKERSQNQKMRSAKNSRTLQVYYLAFKSEILNRQATAQQFFHQGMCIVQCRLPTISCCSLCVADENICASECAFTQNMKSIRPKIQDYLKYCNSKILEGVSYIWKCSLNQYLEHWFFVAIASINIWYKKPHVYLKHSKRMLSDHRWVSAMYMNGDMHMDYEELGTLKRAYDYYNNTVSMIEDRRYTSTVSAGTVAVC